MREFFNVSKLTETEKQLLIFPVSTPIVFLDKESKKVNLAILYNCTDRLTDNYICTWLDG